MLKIKDNIDLKELEKYGFKYESNWALRRYTNGNVYVFENNDLQNEEYCNKDNFTFLNPRCIYFRRNILNQDDDFISSNDILYDLIKDGLVEKVEN